MKKDKVSAIANEILDAQLTLNGKDKISTVKLQKLAFFSYAWHLINNQEYLFSKYSYFQAWKMGPIFRPLFNLHRQKFLVD